VQVSRVDLDGRRIDFRLVRDGDDIALRAMKDKGASHDVAPRVPRDEQMTDKSSRRSKSRKGAESAPRGRNPAGSAGKSPTRNGATGKRSRSSRR
jgi:ribonuclease R